MCSIHVLPETYIKWNEIKRLNDLRDKTDDGVFNYLYECYEAIRDPRSLEAKPIVSLPEASIKSPEANRISPRSEDEKENSQNVNRDCERYAPDEEAEGQSSKEQPRKKKKGKNSSGSKYRRKISSVDCRKTPSNGLSLEPPASSQFFGPFDSITPSAIISDSVIDFSRSAKFNRSGYDSQEEESLARLSLPSQLRILSYPPSTKIRDDDEEISNESPGLSHSTRGVGVFAQLSLEKHSRFGPLVGDQVQETDINKNTDFQHLWKVSESIYISTSEPETSNWFRYLTPAPSKATCNCVFVCDLLNQKGYLITTREIRPYEELLFWTDWAWNDEEFAKIPSKTNCGGCNLSFGHVLQYALHIRTLHDPRYSLTIRKYHCKICGIGILGKENFVSHLTNLHRGEGGHQCQYCKKYFLRQSYLETHRSYGCPLNPDRSIPLCDLCGKKFSQPQKLKIHKKRMHGKPSHLKEFECDVCSKILGSTQGLLRHKREVHMKSESFLCLKCDKSFTNKSNLKIHQLTHSKIKPFGCREKNCSTRFTTKQCLQLHYVKIHNKAKEDIPTIERDVPYTDEAYAGDRLQSGSSIQLREEENDKMEEAVLHDDSESFDGTANAENERIDVGGTEEIDLLLASHDKTDAPLPPSSGIPSHTVNDIIGVTEDQRSSEEEEEEEEENSFYEFPESTFNLGEAASINRPQIQVPIPSSHPGVPFESHYESDNTGGLCNLTHHQRNSSTTTSFFHSFSEFSPYYHHHPPSFYSAFSAVSEDTPSASSSDFANHLYPSHHPPPHHAGEMSFQNYYPHQSHHHQSHHSSRFPGTTPGHAHHPHIQASSYYSYF